MRDTKERIKKVCNFYVSEWHLVTMLLPYISKQTKEQIEVTTILERNLDSYIRTLLEKINLKNRDKNSIINVGWEKSNTYVKLDNILSNTITKEKIIIIINGSNNYIEEINNHIEKWNENIQYNNCKITIVNCYDVSTGIDMENILKLHDKVLNTSGEKEIYEYC